jgi:AraC-like DNA-binding protein
MIGTTNMASLLLILWNILESYEIDPEPLFQETSLNPELMKQSGGRYRIDNIDHLWRKAAEVIDDPCFGLKAAEVWHPSNLGALGYAMLASHSLRTSLERLVRYLGFLSDKDVMELDETEEGLRLTLVLSQRNVDKSEQNDAALALILSMCRMNYIEDLAQKYLREEDTSMTEIAFLLGFSESSAFSRAFKRWMGVSPTTYRKAS